MTRISSKTMILAKTVILMSTMVVVLYAFSTGPPPGHTGGFGEPTCQACHDFGPSDGTFNILGVPDQYTPGEVYPITVEISQSGQVRWGFQLAARFQADGSQAGTLEVIDPDLTQIMEQAGIQYIEHTSLGTMNGTPDGPVSWTFNWIAPDTPSDTVQFNAAGNAANGDGTQFGDFIYTDEVTSDPGDGGGD